MAKNKATDLNDILFQTIQNIIDPETNTKQFIELKKGWNIFSTYLNPTDKKMDTVMSNLCMEGDLIKVKDEIGNTFEINKLTLNWMNNIGDILEPEGYKIRVNSDCTLEISGKPIQLPLNIEIKTGWNLISFPVNGSINALDAVQPLINAGILTKVQDERGNSIEKWFNTGWRNGIGNFNAGEGYLLQASNSGILTINNIEVKSCYFVEERLKPTYFKVSYDGYGIDHMKINIVELNKSDLKVGDELAAFDGEICVGAIKLTAMDFNNNTISIPVSAAEQEGVNGFTDGNAITLKFWNNETNKESGLQIEAAEGELTFNRYSSVFVNINENQIVNGISDFNLLNISVYPNPANNVVNVSFSNLPETGTEITIMDINGREIIRRTVENMNETMNIQQLSDGMYLVKIQLNNNFKIQKLIKN